MRHPGQVLSRQQILDGVWGYTFDPRSNLVDVYVGYLRRKLAMNGSLAHRDRAWDGLPAPARAGGVRLRVPIRLRLALVSAALAAAVLAAGLLTVYLIEAHQVHQTLVADARAAARDLALAGEHTNGNRAARQSPKPHTPPPTPSHEHRKTPAGGASTGVIVPPPVTGSNDSSQTGGTTWTRPATGGGESDDGGGGGWSGQSGGGESGGSPAGPGGGRADVAFRIPATAASPAAAEADDATETRALETYLGARSGSDQLLLYIPAHGRTLGNSHAATWLAGLGGAIPGSVRAWSPSTAMGTWSPRPHAGPGS